MQDWYWIRFKNGKQFAEKLYLQRWKGYSEIRNWNEVVKWVRDKRLKGFDFPEIRTWDDFVKLGLRKMRNEGHTERPRQDVMSSLDELQRGIGHIDREVDINVTIDVKSQLDALSIEYLMLARLSLPIRAKSSSERGPSEIPKNNHPKLEKVMPVRSLGRNNDLVRSPEKSDNSARKKWTGRLVVMSCPKCGRGLSLSKSKARMVRRYGKKVDCPVCGLVSPVARAPSPTKTPPRNALTGQSRQEPETTRKRKKRRSKKFIGHASPYTGYKGLPPWPLRGSIETGKRR